MLLKFAVSMFLLLWAFPSIVRSHEISQPFVHLNGNYVIHNPVPINQEEPLKITHEVASENYLALKEINLKVDTFKLNKPIEWIKDASFSWDLGDGSRKDGLQIKHTYQKPGTYFITVFGKTGDFDYQKITEFTVNILPMQNYRLPISAIELNNSNFTSSKTTLPFSQELQFNGLKSKPGSANLTEYFWSYGDGQSGSGTQVVHKFDSHHYNSFVILRVKDANGFIADSYLEITNQQNVVNLPELSRDSPRSLLNYILILGFTVLVLGLLVGFKLLKPKT